MTIILDGTTGITTPAINSSGDLELPGGTANGVLYLNGSKIATSGSALVFDGTNLGVGTSSPAYKLDVRGSTDTSYLNITSTADANGTTLRIGTDATAAFINATGGSSGTLQLRTYGTTKATLDNAGNLGLGVTPSAWYTASKALQVSGAAIEGRGTVAQLYCNGYLDATAANEIYINNGFSTKYRQSDGEHRWYQAASGTAGGNISYTNTLTLDASGNLGVGETSPTTRLHIKSSGGAYLRSVSTNNTVDSYFGSQTNEATVTVASNHPLTFVTNNLERARLTSGGYFKASNNGVYNNSTGAYHELRTTTNNEWTFFINNITAGADPYGMIIRYESSPNSIYSEFFYCQDNASGGTLRASIRSNGGLANYSANDVNLSDERVKTDIAPLDSMWDKFKAIEIVTFKYKDQTHDDNNIGVIAQQVESVAPEFVDVDGFGETPEDGVPLKTIYTTDLYHAAIKALQEAMTRIEELEAKVAALEAK